MDLIRIIGLGLIRCPWYYYVLRSHSGSYLSSCRKGASVAGLEPLAIEVVAWLGTAVTSALAGTSLAGLLASRRRSKRVRVQESPGQTHLTPQQLAKLRVEV